MKKTSSLKTKIFTMLIVTGVIPLLAMSILVERIYSSTIEMNIIPIVESTVDSLSLNLSLRFSNYQALLNECARNPEIEDLVSRKYETDTQKRLASDRIVGVLQATNFPYRIEYPFRYVIYCADGTIFADYRYSSGNNMEELKKNVVSLPYFHDMMETGLVCEDARIEENIFTTGLRKRFDFSRNILNGVSLGIILFSVDSYYFDNLMQGLEFTEGTEVFIHDGYGNNVYRWSNRKDSGSETDVSRYLSVSGNTMLQEDARLVSVHDLGFSTNRKNWKLICVTPLTQVLQRKNLVVFFTWTVSMLVILFALISARSIQKGYLEPVEYYSHYVRDLDFEHLDVPFSKKGIDEVLTLGEGLENMVSRLSENLTELEEKEKEKRRLEQKALTAQINPHFIRNTLNSIRLSAEMSEAPMVADQIQSFTKLIDYIFHAEEMCRVSDEIAYLQEYMKLQNLRYQNKFVFTTDIDDRLMSLKIPTMTFQPAVENSIMHGFAGKKGRGQIRIKGYPEGDLAVFTIEDNGTGIREPDHLLSEGTPHGMTNVNRRILLAYGDAYPIRAENIETGGTRIIITIPFKETTDA